MILLSLARAFTVSCASTLTACAVIWGGSGTANVNVVEISHAFDATGFPGLLVAESPGEKSTTTTSTMATIKSSLTNPQQRLGLVFLDGKDDGAVSSTVSRLQPCPYESNCVSSNYLEPPNRYVSPLRTFRNREKAFARAVRTLEEESESSSPLSTIKVVEILPRKFYIHLTVPGTAAGSLDDVEILFVNNNNDDDGVGVRGIDNRNNNNNVDEGISGGGGIVHLRCISKVTLPPPPFCVQKNCINGNMDQRKRVDTIGRILGLPQADQERMRESAKWTPIFFNSDKVPGFDDEL